MFQNKGKYILVDTIILAFCFTIFTVGKKEYLCKLK